jgi:hypothetical protein
VIVVEIVLWVLAILVGAGALVVVVLAERWKRPALGLVAIAPIAVGALLLAFRLAVPAPAHAFWVILALLVAALGVAAGSPLTTLVLQRTAPVQTERLGVAGGIVVEDEKTDKPREVLRGGAIIGYLERLAIVVSIVVGHPEAVAVIIAVKGLGRFSELVAPEVRERFIIGTLVSIIWAAACGGLIWLAGGITP